MMVKNGGLHQGSTSIVVEFYTYVMSCYLPKLPSFLASMRQAPYAEDWPQSDAHKDVIFNMISCKQLSACRDVEIGSFIEHCLITTRLGSFFILELESIKHPLLLPGRGWKKLSMHSRKNLSKRFQYFSGNVAKNEPSQLILSTVHGS